MRKNYNLIGRYDISIEPHHDFLPGKGACDNATLDGSATGRRIFYAGNAELHGGIRKVKGPTRHLGPYGIQFSNTGRVIWLDRAIGKPAGQAYGHAKIGFVQLIGIDIGVVLTNPAMHLMLDEFVHTASHPLDYFKLPNFDQHLIDGLHQVSADGF
jgi:hypothetical protein